MVVSQIASSVVDLWTPEDAPVRPAGVHFSDVLKDILVKVAPKVYGKPLDPHKIITGVAFERSLEAGFKVTLPDSFRPDPIQSDGIWFSPDHMAIEPTLRGKEFKLTWYSAGRVYPDRNVPKLATGEPDYGAEWPEPHLDCPEFWPYMTQMKNYGHVYQVYVWELWVLFINGDYKPPRPWRPCVFQIEFSPLECLESYEMIVNHAQRLGWI